MNLLKKGTPELMKLVGPAAFYVGLLITLITALAIQPGTAPTGWLFVGLAGMGVIVGLLNITAKETGPFLFSAIAFIVTVLGMQQLISATGTAIPTQLTVLAANVTVFVGSGAVIIALRAIYEVAKNR